MPSALFSRPELVCWWCEPLLHNRGEDCKTAGRHSLLIIFGVVSLEVDGNGASASDIESTFNDLTGRDSKRAKELPVSLDRNPAFDRPKGHAGAKSPQGRLSVN